MDKISKKEKKHSTRAYSLSQAHITKIKLFSPKSFKGDINVGYQLAYINNCNQETMRYLIVSCCN